jgi:hypothetical protein
MRAAARHGRETASWLEQEGLAAMAGAGAKLRVAMGIFEDPPRLEQAAGALLRLGLDPADLCLAAGRAAAAAGGEPLLEPWISVGQTARMLWFQYRGEARAASDCAIVSKTAMVIAETLDAASVPLPCRSPDSAIWTTIDAHLAKGDLLLVARLPSAALQDQAVRALLRHSRQPVHAEEFFMPAEPDDMDSGWAAPMA